MKKNAKLNSRSQDCTSIGLVLCNEVSKNVYGYIGRQNLLYGKLVNKTNACLDLIGTYPLTPTDEEIEAGKDISRRFNRPGKKKKAA